MYSQLLATTTLLFGAANAGGTSGGNGFPWWQPPPGFPGSKIAPKVMIVSMFQPEATTWYNRPDFNLLANNITLPGLSPLFPTVHCEPKFEVCQVITGESEVNAASTISALVLSPKFDLTKTYFMIAGIGGVNPEQATLADVTIQRYTVQVALEYEFDAREIPANFTTGYFGQGATNPKEYPQQIYGTEVFEFNDALRKLAVGFARKATLNDSAGAISYRAKYGTNSKYQAATQKPSVRECDGATSDVYYSGALLGEAFGNYTTLITNGTGVYCTTAQEDNATAEALLRAALAKLVDFSRIILIRTCSDFDRPYPGESVLQNLVYFDQGGFEPSIENIYLAGRQVIKGILSGWQSTFAAGVPPTNYVGDIYNSLPNPAHPIDFGLPDQFTAAQLQQFGGLRRRGLSSRRARMMKRGSVVVEAPSE